MGQVGHESNISDPLASLTPKMLPQNLQTLMGFSDNPQSSVHLSGCKLTIYCTYFCRVHTHAVSLYTNVVAICIYANSLHVHDFCML